MVARVSWVVARVFWLGVGGEYVLRQHMDVLTAIVIKVRNIVLVEIKYE